MAYHCPPKSRARHESLCSIDHYDLNTRRGVAAQPRGTCIVTLKNAKGMEVRAIAYGAIITSIRVPDRDGRFDDVVLVYDTEDEYMKNTTGIASRRGHSRSMG